MARAQLGAPPSRTTDATTAGGVITSVNHDGTTSGPTRPTGYAIVLWVNPLGTSYARPTNMATGDIWLHTA